MDTKTNKEKEAVLLANSDNPSPLSKLILLDEQDLELIKTGQKGYLDFLKTNKSLKWL